MCLHASWMSKEFCTRCTPIPKVEKPAKTPTVRARDPFAARKLARATNEFDIDDELIETLCARSNNGPALRRLLTSEFLPEYRRTGDPGCIFYRPIAEGKNSSWERNIRVRLMGGGVTLTSAPRAAWAAARANRDTYLPVGQNAVHLCSTELRHDIRVCCVNPAHVARL